MAFGAADESINDVLALAPWVGYRRTGVKKSSNDLGSMERKENLIQREEREKLAGCRIE